MRATAIHWFGCALVGLGAATLVACSDSKVETGKHRGGEPQISEGFDAESPSPPADANAAVSAETVVAAVALEGLIEARVYFAQEDAVAAGVRAYFGALNQRSGNLQLRDVSPDEDPHAARAAAGPEKRMVALDYGGRRRAIGLTVRDGEVDQVDLDTVVRAVLLKLAPRPDAGTVYRTVGHGELAGQGGDDDAQAWTALRKLLEELGAAMRDLGPRELAAGVPDNAAAVVLLGPTERLPAQELASLEAYVSRGGSLLVAFDLAGGNKLDNLAAYLGVRFEAVLLADDEHKVRAEGGPTHPTTREFGDHPAVAVARRGSVWIPLVRSGVLWDAARPGRAMKATRTRLVQSAASAFLDRNRDGELDPGAEKRGAYTVALALEAADGAPPGRVVVFADAPLFHSDVLGRFRGAQLVGGDVLRWLLRTGDGDDAATPKQ